MRILHTSDWHLGKLIRGLSRQPEFEAVLGEVVDVARRESVDIVLVAGDIFDSFSPPQDAERLLYGKLEELVRSDIQVVLLAGNHDHAAHMEALRGLLRLAGVHSFGAVTTEPEQARILLPSRDKKEEARIVAMPWVPERFAFDFESLSGSVNQPIQQYAGRMEQAIAQLWGKPSSKTINVFAAHLLLDGAVIGPGGGERRMQIGQNFAVKASALPSDADYTALGHIHKPQPIAVGRPIYYAGSLLQLDFGESQQECSVKVVDLKPGLPAQARTILVAGGRQLRNVTLAMEDLGLHAEQYGEAYLKVTVELDAPVQALFQQVKDYLPNAVEVIAKLPDIAGASKPEERRGLQPDELFARYYGERKGGEISAEMREAFGALLREANEVAPA